MILFQLAVVKFKLIQKDPSKTHASAYLHFILYFWNSMVSTLCILHAYFSISGSLEEIFIHQVSVISHFIAGRT